MSQWETAGKVRMTPKGIWDSTAAYNTLDLVTDATGTMIYLSKKNVPAGTLLTNTSYWVNILDVSNIQEIVNDIGMPSTTEIEMQNGYYVHVQDGVLVENAGSSATNYIPVKEGYTIKLANLYLSGNRGVVLYNDQYQFISALEDDGEQTTITFTVPVNVAYFRASCRINETLAMAYIIPDSLDNRLNIVNSNIAVKKEHISAFDKGYYDVGSYAYNDTVDVESMTSSNTYYCTVIPIYAGNVLNITGTGGDTARLYTITDSSYNLIRYSAQNEVRSNYNILIEKDGYVIINLNKEEEYDVNILNIVSGVDTLDENCRIVTYPYTTGYIAIPDIGETVTFARQGTNTYVCYIIPVDKGDLIKITGTGASTARLWCKTDLNYVVQSRSATDASEEDFYLLIDSNGYLIVNSYNTEDNSVIKYSKSDYIDNYINAFSQRTFSELQTTWDYTNTFESGYIKNDLVPWTIINTSNKVSSSSYVHCVIPVEAGDAVVVTGEGASAARLWSILNSSKELLSSATSSTIASDEILLKIIEDGYVIVQAKKNSSYPYSAKLIKNYQLCDSVYNNSAKAFRFYLRRNYDIKYANSEKQLLLYNSYTNFQNVHPKVLYFSDGLYGYKYWMAYTPYDFGHLNHENPCIAYSQDGFNWYNIRSNPLDTEGETNSNMYNSDTHLLYNEDQDRLECWYRKVTTSAVSSEDAYERLMRSYSTDGVTWSEPQIMIDRDTTTSMLSPAIIYDSVNTRYRMWCVESNQNVYTIKYYESNNSTGIGDENWTLIREIDLEYTYDEREYSPWHMDLIIDNNKYVLLVMCKDTWSTNKDEDWPLFITTSTDNTTYSTPECLMVGNDGQWDDRLYRSSIVNVDGKYRIYYSARNSTNVFGMSLTESDTLSDFIGHVW